MLAYLTATVTPPALGDIIQNGMLDTLKDLFVRLTTWFTVFPLNIFLSLSIIAIAISLASKIVSAFRASN